MISLRAVGHMEMVKPLPIRSAKDPNATNPDYDYVSPLNPSGSNYPCKGYHTDEFRAAAEYQAGQSYTMEIGGGAAHQGGSCQLSLSYDNGGSFSVIKSMIVGCPLTTTYDFTIPADAPSGDVLFAWSWFNKVGNREMYMNCAFVTISGSSSKLRSRSGRSPRLDQRQNSTPNFGSAPSIFIANVQGPGNCMTTEGKDVQFPSPGEDVEYGGETDGPGFECSGTPPGSPNGDTPAPPAPPTDPAPVPTAGPDPPSTTLSTLPAPPAPTGSSSHPPVASQNPPTPPAGGQCSTGEITCNSPTSWSLCFSGNFVFMGSVATGTTCEGGSIVGK